MKPNFTDDQKLFCLDLIHINLWIFDPGAMKRMLPQLWGLMKVVDYTGSVDELETLLQKLLDQIKNCKSKPKFIKGPDANEKYKYIRESLLAQGHRVGEGVQHHEPVQAQQKLDRGDPRGIPVLFGPPSDDIQMALQDADGLQEEECEEEEYEALADDEYHLADGTLVRNIDVQEEYAEEQNGAQDLDVGRIGIIDAPEVNDPAVEHEDNEEMVAPEAEENVIEWNGRLEASVAVEDVDQIQFHGSRDQVATPPAPNATESPTPFSTGSCRTPVSQGQETQRKGGKTVGGAPNPKTAVRRGGRSVVRMTSGATAASTTSTSNKTHVPTAIRPGRAGYRDGKFVDVDRPSPAQSATRGRGRTPQAAKSTATTVKTRGRTPKATACGGVRTPAKRGRTPALTAPKTPAPARTKATAAMPRGRTPKTEKTVKRKGKSPGGEVPRKKGRSVNPTARVPPASKKNVATPRSEATRKRSRSVAHPPSQDHSVDSRELFSHFRSPAVKNILNYFASNMPQQEMASVTAHLKSFLEQKGKSTSAKKRRNG